jgi:hypothetical protein
MDENKIKEMVKSALLKPMSENINSKEYLSNRKQVKEEKNPIDTITMDVPLFIRMMEFAREDAKGDLDLHNIAEKAIALSTSGKVLNMADYDVITSSEINEQVDMKELEDTLKRLKKENPDKKIGYAFIKDSPKGYKISIDGKYTQESLKEAESEENIQDDDVLGDMISDMLKYKTKEEVLQYLRQQVALHYDDVKDSKPKIPKGKMEEGMGNEVGDVVYFKGNLGEKYPASQGYYGVIEDVTPASNYNMLATYQVVVCDENDDEVGIVNTSFLNLSSKLKISTPKLKSMAETIMSKLKR